MAAVNHLEATPIMSGFSVEAVRAQFPSLALKDDGKPRVYFDNPAGTQVPQRVIDRATQAMISQNANLGGAFITSKLAQDLVDRTRIAAAQFYNAPSPSEIMFGANMTTMTLAMSRNLQKSLKISEGDEIVLSRMDHDANVAPWLHVAADTGATVKWLEFDPGTFEFADDAIDQVLTDKTKIVAVGHASNCTGTINDVAGICRKARAAGAVSFVDAVQSAPHLPIDVQAIGCDFLVSSAYKWFGPHQGIMYGRRALMEQLYSYNVRPALEYGPPGAFESGTAPRETLAATLGAIEYIASHGEDLNGGIPVSRTRIVSGMTALQEHEMELTRQLIAGLTSIKGVKVRGITSANALHRRVPTVSVTVQGKNPADLAEAFAAENIFLWSGHNYALEPINHMKLMDKGGVLRIGLAHYNTADEVDTMLNRLEGMV
jgi:cysteine desulfurase family protein (TIGR01976 family)